MPNTIFSEVISFFATCARCGRCVGVFDRVGDVWEVFKGIFHYVGGVWAISPFRPHFRPHIILEGCLLLCKIAVFV